MTRKMQKKYLLKSLRPTLFYRTPQKELHMITLLLLQGILPRAKVGMDLDLSINGKIQNLVQTLITFQTQAHKTSRRILKGSILFSRILNHLSLSLISHSNLEPLPLKWLTKFSDQSSPKIPKSSIFFIKQLTYFPQF